MILWFQIIVGIQPLLLPPLILQAIPVCSFSCFYTYSFIYSDLSSLAGLLFAGQHEFGAHLIQNTELLL